MTARNLLRQHDGDDPPPWTGVGYDCEQFGRWLRRQFRREAGVTDDGQIYDYEQERARLTKAQADKTELESQELRGEMVRVPEVVEEWARQTGAARSRMLSVPTKAGPRARSAGSDDEAAKVIEVEVLEALQELSIDGLPDRTRRRVDAARRREADAARARGQGRVEEAVDASAEADRDGVGGQVPAPKSGKRRRAG
jgi:hypothetical protein